MAPSSDTLERTESALPGSGDADDRSTSTLRRPVAGLSIRWRRAVVLTGLLGFALAFQGSRPLWEPDEGRYVAVALEMVRTGDWLVPHLHPEYEHFTKPPMAYWAIAGGLLIVGRSEWGVRLPNALAFAATVLLVYGIGRRLAPCDAGLAALVYASFLMTTVAANIANTDTLLTLWETFAVLGFVSWRWGRSEPERRWLVAMWLGFGLAFLTKGPVGLMPLLAIVVLVAMEGGRRGLRSLFPPIGLAVFAVVAFGWFVVVIAREPALLSYFLGNELVGRVFTGVHHRNAVWYGAAVVYLPAFLLGCLPWTPFLLGRIRRVGDLLRPTCWRTWRRQDPALIFTLLWLLLPLSVFMVARSRLVLYVLPLFPALAILTARTLRPHWRWSRLQLVLVGVCLAALLGLRAGAAHLSSHQDARALAQQLDAIAGGTEYDEIVLVGVREGFGLSFYLGRPVEHVAVQARSFGRSCPYCLETLLQELADVERWLFVVDERNRIPFEEVVRRSGRTLTVVGTIGTLTVYGCRRG